MNSESRVHFLPRKRAAATSSGFYLPMGSGEKRRLRWSRMGILVWAWRMIVNCQKDVNTHAAVLVPMDSPPIQ